MDIDYLYQVNRLVYLSLAHSHGKKALIIRNQDEIRELIQKFQAEVDFQRAVEQALRAMDLQILTLEDEGLRLSSLGAESLFSMTVTDYSKLLGRGDLKAADILCVHAAVATALFPQERDLDLPVEDLGAVTFDDIFEVLRQFAGNCPDPDEDPYENSDEDAKEETDDRLHPQMITLAQRFREMPEDNPDIKQSGAGNSWRELVDQVVRHMAAHRYLLAFEEGDGAVEYRPTPAYQAAVREGMVYTFHAFRDIVNQGRASQHQAEQHREDQDHV